MSSLVESFKNDKEVQKYVELRKKIEENPVFFDALKCKLSDNKAKIEKLEVEMVIDEYLELELLVKEKLDFIKDVIENELNF